MKLFMNKNYANQVYIILRAILNREAATVFALLADETSNVSLKEQLCVCIRWVDDNFTDLDAPLELFNVPKTVNTH